MRTGFRGTFVISWMQTEVNGRKAGSVHMLDVGATWAWHGEVVRVDGPGELLQLEAASGEAENRRRAARMARRLAGGTIASSEDPKQAEPASHLPDSFFVVTDGEHNYNVSVINLGGETLPLLMFVDEIPPANTMLLILQYALDRVRTALRQAPPAGDTICFTPGTRIATPQGDRLIEELREGDLVQTMDDGAEEIIWIGQRRMTGARLFAMPKLRPIRIRQGAFGIERPDDELLVSPDHRLLITGAVAQDLFNTPEVLVAARDLLDERRVTADVMVREVTYIHIMLPRHQILWANGMECESFHPGQAALPLLAEQDRARLLACFPELEHDPLSYGNYARRSLNKSEAAILQYAGA